jgi:hypothetical protein
VLSLFSVPSTAPIRSLQPTRAIDRGAWQGGDDVLADGKGM